MSNISNNTSICQLEIKKRLFIEMALEKMSGKKLPTASEMEKKTGSPTDRSNWHRIFNGKTKQPRREIISFLANYLEIEVNQVWNVLQAAGEINENTDENKILNNLIPIFRMPENIASDSRYFVGRKEYLEKLESNILKQEHKIIGIIAFAGTGKTTLISKLIRKLYQDKIAIFNAVVWKEFNAQVDNERPPIIKEFVNSILYNLSNGEITNETTRQDDFEGITKRLLSQLRKQRCLIVIDNAEALLSDKNKELGESGTFAEECREYYYLFNKILQTEHCSKLILNSRESFVELRSPNYSELILPGLNQEYAIELISNLSDHEVENGAYKLKGTESDLIALTKKCSGNPKAIELVIPLIQRDKEFQGSVNLFLKQDKPIDGICTILKEVVNRLNEKQRECLTRISVYQDRHLISFNGILSQMDRLDEYEIRQIIDDLKVASLLKAENKFQDENYPIYKIHPFVKEYCYRLLDNKMLNESHIRAANYYQDKAGNCREVQEVDAAFEAIHHFYEARMFNDCYEIFIFKILNAKKLDNLRCSANLWNNVDRITEVAPKLISKLSDLQKRAIALVPLGFVYSEAGKNLKALEVSDEILKIIGRKLNKDEELIFTQIAAYINKGRAYRLIGNFKQSQKDCETASKYAKKLKKLSWQALAIYELGLIHIELEKPKPIRAIGCFITAAFQAIGEKVVPSGVHSFKNLLSGEELNNGAKKEIETTVMSNSEDSSQDHTKKFRILYNIGRALNILKLHTPSEFILGIAERFVTETDIGSPIWLYTELATCYGKKLKAYDYLNRAYSRKEKAPMICNALTLHKYAELEYSCEHYEDALKKYEELEELLREAEFPRLQMQAHYGQAHCYEKLYSKPNVNFSTSGYKEKAEEHIKKAREICEKWSLPSL